MEEKPHILLVSSNKETSHLITHNILEPAGYRITAVNTHKEGKKLVKAAEIDILILGNEKKNGAFLQFAAKIKEIQPTLPIIVFADETTDSLPLEAAQIGFLDWLTPPLHPERVLESVQRGLKRKEYWEEWFKTKAKSYTGTLEQKLGELQILAQVGRSVTAELDLDNVLKVVVDAAVKLSDAEEGSILLIDEDSGELYMRAARNFNDDFVRTFRLPVQDTLAGNVIQSGEPLILSKDKPQKILTSYLVHALIYVPLKIHGQVIGVLGVDNRESGRNYSEQHLTLISTLADYAVVAIENAQLYQNTEIERNKLETIITQIDDGVIVCDTERRLLLVNPAVRKLFNLDDQEVLGLLFADVFDHEDLVNAMKGKLQFKGSIEIEIDNSRTYSVQITTIPEIGNVATLHDISYLKELDRIKSDFVNAVSHDLRSPLTAILGYVELIGRVGEVNKEQKEFIQYIQTSVNNITDLISDLLDLGRIEVGIADELESISINEILKASVEGLKSDLKKKKQKLELGLTKNIPNVAGNPLQLSQMLNNLLSNAIKYTPEKGLIKLTTIEEDEQIIIQVIDTGMGIPAKDQYRIFDKFFRATNTPEDSQGTGLGLAIVQSIVNNHQGRIWVDSIIGTGSTFTVVLPIEKKGKSVSKKDQKKSAI